MYADVLDGYLVRINKDLASKGLTYDDLREDILDHICCMVEEDMESGEDFESSYRRIMSGIDDAVLPDLQHQTLLLLDKKFQKMKKITYVIGLVGSLLAITGAFFKTQHWPGASILMVLGFMAVVLGFLPLYFVGSYKEQSEKPHPIYPIVAYLSLFFIFTGAVFKVMHWPGAGILLKVSVFALLVGFLPLYIVQLFKRSVKSKINPAYIIMLLVGISIVLILSKVNLGKDSIDRYVLLSNKYEDATLLMQERINELSAGMSDSVLTSDVKKVISYSDALEMQLEQMSQGLLESVGQAGASINNVQKLDFRNGAGDAYINNGLAMEFLADCREYQEFLMKIIDDPLTSRQVEIELLFSGGHWINWDPLDYRNEPLIVNYYKLTTFKWAVIHAEYLTLKDLL